MAIIIELKDGYKASSFIQQLNILIDNNTIETWLLDSDGDYTHSPLQWNSKAWFRAHPQKLGDRELKFGILKPKSTKLSKTIYAVYHGRFAEMLLAHFDDVIVNIKITSLLIPDIDFA